MRIPIAEDERLSRHLLENTFRGSGHDVVSVAAGSADAEPGARYGSQGSYSQHYYTPPKRKPMKTHYYPKLSLKHNSLSKRKFRFMLKSQSLTTCLVLVAGILAGSGVATQAQTTILNAPSTDVQITGKTYLETDFVSHLTRFEKGGFQVYGLRLLYGASKKLEVGANLIYTRAAGSPQAVEVQPNAKWQFYQNEEKGVAIAAGGVLYLPFPHHQASDTLGLFYVTASKKVKASYGPRFTGGAYHTVGLSTGSKGGAILGYEQPVHRRFTLLADWYSGKNRLGYSSAGIGATISRRSNLYVCYIFGNAGRANNSLGVFYGWTF